MNKARQFRTISLGFREVLGVLVSSGVRIEESRAGKWVYHSTQPDMGSTKSLMHSIAKGYEIGNEIQSQGGNLVFDFR